MVLLKGYINLLAIGIAYYILLRHGYLKFQITNCNGRAGERQSVVGSVQTRRNAVMYVIISMAGQLSKPSLVVKTDSYPGLYDS